MVNVAPPLQTGPRRDRAGSLAVLSPEALGTLEGGASSLDGLTVAQKAIGERARSWRPPKGRCSAYVVVSGRGDKDLRKRVRFFVAEIHIA